MLAGQVQYSFASLSVLFLQIASSIRLLKSLQGKTIMYMLVLGRRFCNVPHTNHLQACQD